MYTVLYNVYIIKWIYTQHNYSIFVGLTDKQDSYLMVIYTYTSNNIVWPHTIGVDVQLRIYTQICLHIITVMTQFSWNVFYHMQFM